MGYARQISIYCDGDDGGCDTEEIVLTGGATYPALKRAAEKQGWDVTSKRALCPKHREAPQ